MRRKQQPEIQVFDIPFPDTTDIECQVLADAIETEQVFDDVIPVVHPEFFTTPERQSWWTAIVEKYNAGESIKTINIAPVLGPSFVREIIPYTTNCGSITDPILHAHQLRDGAAKRRAYYAAALFIRDAVLPQSTEEDIITGMEQLQRSVEGPAPFMAEKKLDKVLDEVREEVKKTEKMRHEGKSIRISTGFKYMDMAFYGGFKAGQLVVLAARPSVGKTAVMFQFAKAAAKAGHPAMIFTLEMTREELGERFLFSTGKVTPYNITHGDILWQAYEQADGELRPLQLYINDFSRSLDEITTRLNQAVKQSRCKIAFIDYLGLMSDAMSFGNAKLYQVIARITGTLKAVAKRLGIPIVLLCQLNREQAREGRSPELYDLRDSGSIEQDADIVLMLELNPPKNKIQVDTIIYAWLRKNRAGRSQMAFPLEPNETYSAFTEHEPVDKDFNSPQDDIPEYTPQYSPEPEEDDDDSLPF